MYLRERRDQEKAMTIYDYVWISSLVRCIQFTLEVVE